MQIDWFTFVAQIVNFLILIGLLKRFLYRPILHAMDEREERISSRLEEARKKEEDAEEEAQVYRAMQEELEQDRKAQLAEAERAAEERRQTLIQEARDDVAHLEREWREALERERESFLQELSERAVHETIAVARQALQDLADADLEAQAVEVFIERLQTPGDAQRTPWTEALKAANGMALVRSAFDLTDQHQTQIREAIEEHVGAVSELSFETSEEIGFGVELRVGERKVAWSLDSYLTHLADRVRERLDAELRTGHTQADEGPAAEHPVSMKERT